MVTFYKKILIVLLLLFLAIGSIQANDFSDINKMSIEEIAKAKLHHTQDGRFHNPWCSDCKKRFFDFFRWKFSKNSFSKEEAKEEQFKIVTPDFSALSKTSGDYFVWLGQSTVLMRIGKKIIITDPIFGDINFFIKRKTPFPVDLKNLPKIDFVLISHGHYDHLDTQRIEFLKKVSDPVFITEPGFNEYLAGLKISKHIVIDWWEEYKTEGLKITSLPVQHWSKRGLFDLNKMLWASFLIEENNLKYYWIGDSAYYRGFKEIGEKFGPIDFLFVPIGAYEPRWFMKQSHINPEEAIQIAKDVNAKNFIPIHWGTFLLSDEPLWLPIKHLKEIYPDNEINPYLIQLDHGGSYQVSN